MTEREALKEHFNTVATLKDQSYEDRRWGGGEREKQQKITTEAFITQEALPYLGHPTSIIELGPGPGTWTRLLAKAFPESSVTLTDISKEMLLQAKQTTSFPDTVVTVEGEFLESNLPQNAFEAFFSSRALEYVSDKRGAAKKILSLLEKGGRGCVITKTPKKMADLFMGRKRSSRHKGQITPSALVALLQEAGAVEIKLYPVTVSFPFFKSAKADMWLHGLLKKQLTPLSSLFSESYAVLFSKP